VIIRRFKPEMLFCKPSTRRPMDSRVAVSLIRSAHSHLKHPMPRSLRL
jgi:hypothetical protein